MDLKEEIQNAIKSGNAIIGYRRSLKYVKSQKPRIVVVASNIPERLKNEFVHNAGVAGAGVETFGGSSIDLGVLCGRPFPIAVMVIK